MLQRRELFKSSLQEQAWLNRCIQITKMSLKNKSSLLSTYADMIHQALSLKSKELLLTTRFAKEKIQRNFAITSDIANVLLLFLLMKMQWKQLGRTMLTLWPKMKKYQLKVAMRMLTIQLLWTTSSTFVKSTRCASMKVTRQKNLSLLSWSLTGTVRERQAKSHQFWTQKL